MSLAASKPKPILLSRKPFENEPRQMHSTLIDFVPGGNANSPTQMTSSSKPNTESRNWLTKKNSTNQPFKHREPIGYSATQNTLYLYLSLNFDQTSFMAINYLAPPELVQQ